MNKKKVTAALAAGLAALALSGCSYKQVDPGVTGATLVPGTGTLHRFCDGNTLIYYTDRSSTDDEYEFIVYDGCSADPNAKPRVAGE